MNLKYLDCCRICGNSHLSEILDFGEQYNQGSFVYPNKLPPPFRKIPHKILRCNTQLTYGSCGLIQNRVVVPPQVLYQHYGYRTSTSQTMKYHLLNVYNDIITVKVGHDLMTFQKQLERIKVLDIGANDGFFLNLYPDEILKLAIDPSDAVEQIDSINTFVVKGTYPDDKTAISELIKTQDKQFDIITAIACLYDVDYLHAFVKSLEMDLKIDGIFVAEVAYLHSVIENLAFDQFCFEHVSTFSLATLERLFRYYDLKIFKAQKTDTNGGSLLFYVCHSNCNKFDNTQWQNELNILRFKEFEMALDDPRTYEDFCAKIKKVLNNLYKFILEEKRKGKRIHILGASTKLNTILQTGNIGPDLIDFASERNPDKVGGQLMNGIPIISEEESRKLKPDYYLVGPTHFRNELLAREKEIRKQGTKFIFPVPHLEIL